MSRSKILSAAFYPFACTGTTLCYNRDKFVTRIAKISIHMSTYRRGLKDVLQPPSSASVDQPVAKLAAKAQGQDSSGP